MCDAKMSMHPEQQIHKPNRIIHSFFDDTTIQVQSDILQAHSQLSYNIIIASSVAKSIR